MTRIAALNDFNVGSSDEEDAGPTREVLEAEASKNYNEAIRHLASGNLDNAYDLFCLILKNPYIEKACWPDGVEPGGTLPQDLALRYSCLKNLGNLACKRGEYEQSVNYYIEAVKLDKSDVTLWHRLGAASIKLRDFELALVAFQEGYNVNPKHWPCLDQLLSVLFILKMYMDCLGLAINALHRDPGYIKALAFRDKIFELQPSLKKDVKLFFKDSSVLFKAVDYDKAKGDKFISTCESLRPPNKSPLPPTTIPCQKLRKPLGDLSWDNLAQALLSTYDSLIEEDGMTFAAKIDIYEALNKAKSKLALKDMEDLGVAPLENGLDSEKNEKSKGEFNSSNEDDENYVEKDKTSAGDEQGNPIRITGRRRTIELGESQDSFRVSEKRRSVDSDSSRSEDNKPEDKPVNPTEAKGRLEEVKEKNDHEGQTEMDHDAKVDSCAAASDPPEIKEEVMQDENVEIPSNVSSEKQSEGNSDEKLHNGSKTTGEEKNMKAQDEAFHTDAVDGKLCTDPVIDGESDNDFQGFTNTSAYKDRHLKLMQEKSTSKLNVTADEEDFGAEVSYDVENQANEVHCSEKALNETGISDELNISVVEQKDGELQTEEINNASEMTEPQEEPETANQEMENVGEVGFEKNASDVVTDEDENMHVGESELFQDEEPYANEDNRVDESEDIQEEKNADESDAGENDAEHMEDIGMQANEGDGIEENEVGLEENEGYNEENIEEHEDGELVENEGEMEEMEDGIEEGNEGDENEGYQEEEMEEGMEDEGLSGNEVTETEAAVNALKGIMALQPTEILGLPEPDFDYENEYVEYFDGGVYEEEEEEEGGEEMDESMDQGEEEQQEEQEDSQEIDESQETTEQEGDVDQECDNDDGAQQDDFNPEVDGEQGGDTQDGMEEEDNQQGAESPEDDREQGGDTQEEIEEEDNQQGAEKDVEKMDANKSSGEEGNNQKETTDTEKQTENHGKPDCDEDQYPCSGNEGADFAGEKEDTNTNTNSMRKRYSTDADETTTETSDKPEKMGPQGNARKSKRTKRGLERELEQLDYWGRRQERDAKRRRRTISSKLLGAIEEAEYLTWADLLRSFVPTALLTMSEEKKKKTEQEKTVDNQTGKGESLSNDKSVTLNLEPSSKTSDHVVSVDKKPELKGNDTEMNIEKEVVSSSDAEKSVNDSNQRPSDEHPQNLEKSSEEVGPVEKKVVISAEASCSKTVCGTDDDQSENTSRHQDEIILSPTATEEEQVQAFLVRYEENGGILHLLQLFMKILLKRHRNNIWPLSAAKMFIAAYPRVRNHVTHASPFNLKENIQRLYEESMLSLTQWELCSSIYQSSKVSTPAGGQGSPSNPFTGDPDHLEEDMFRLMLMLGRGDVWVEESPQFHTRLRWLQAQIRLIRGQPDEAASYLELLSADLDRLANEGVEYICNRARVEADTVIVCSSEVKRQLNVLQRSHMLEQVVRNYTDGRYREVADLLTSIFHEPLPKSRPGVTLPIRQTQLAILIDSLHKLAEYKDVMMWGSQALTEALMRFNRAEAEEEKSRWAKTLTTITDTINTMLTNNIKTVNEVDQERMVELVSTLIRMLVVQLDKPQSASILPFETLTPWTLLHRLLSNEESRQEQSESKNASKTSETNELTPKQKTADDANTATNSEVKETASEEAVVDVETVPTAADQKAVAVSETKIQDGAVTTTAPKGPVTPYPSTLFLITAHEELGKHSWCCYDDGVFLLYCLDVLLAELRRNLDDQHRQLLHHTLEQVTFCLYSHPSKKSKHKHLRDHGVPQIAFCWERAMQLYQYYRPNVLPDFQSSQIPSITDDAATLFKRIIALLPDDAKPADQTAGVEAYINGEVAECNYTPFAPPTDIISDCFYLLGDYYFKNKEWTNAIKYYKLDLSVNHERLESWAPLGLAMKAMLESQLNSCEVIEDEEAFFSLAKAAVQCLRQALKLDPYHTNLWVEFGGLVYMVHSHASRLLKQDLNPDISLETFDMLEKLKSEMLTQAELCFTKALNIQEEGWDDEGLPDERWLHCYMLGKVAEKMNKPPVVIIQYYTKAAHYLHNIRARYPSRINYNNPQEYSVEALEMYYRVHAFILKYLHQREGRDVEAEVLDTFTKCLDELAAGHFANCKEKKNSDENGLELNTNNRPDPVDNDGVQKKRQLEDQDALEPPTKKLQSDYKDGDELGAKDKETEQNVEKKEPEVLSKGDSQGLKPVTEKEKKESDDEIQVVEEKVLEKKKDHFILISRCLSALRMCLSRFHENYKTMYRLSHYYHTSKFHKDNVKAQNYLLGCAFWQNVGYMPVNGLFHERKVWIQQPRNCNFFHGVWRIPNDEIDRPGSFAAHMYRCISLILDILPQTKDFFMILQIALALKNSPDKDKKYLRDNERELLSEHATQVGLQVMKDKYKAFFKGPGPVNSNRHLRFLLDVYRGYKQISKHLPGSEPHFAKMLTDAYASYKDIKVENRSNVLREADSFCNRQQYIQHRNPVSTTNAPNFSSTVASTVNTNQTPVVGRRGRPPLTNRGRGRGRGYMYNTHSRTVGDMLAVQQAYKIYENLLNTQKLLAKKDLAQNEMYTYQKQVETFQAQLMKYLTIPSVSHYFTSSLQGMDANQSKLPPPKLDMAQNPSSKLQNTSSVVSGSAGPHKLPDNTSNQVVSKPPASSSLSNMVNQGSLSVTKSPNTQAGQLKPSLSSLAARSQAHGISIMSIPSSKLQNMQTKPLKAGMSVTVSPVKPTCPPALKGRDISVISVSPSTTSAKSSSSVMVSKTEATRMPSSSTAVSSLGSSSYKSVTATSAGSSVPKLPAGTTITRPQNSTPNKGSGPRPQLQANPRLIKDVQPDVVATAVKKPASQVTSGSSPALKTNESSNTAKSSTSVINKPALPKGMSITPAPRIKTQSRPPASSPSTSFFRAFEASLGLSTNKSVPERAPAVSGSRNSNSVVPRPPAQSQTTSVVSASGKVAQLTTQQLLTLAYADGSSPGGHGRGAGKASPAVSQYTKFLQQQKGQPKQNSSPQLPQGSTLSRVQQSSLKPQATSSMLQLQASGPKQQFKNPQPPRTAQQSSNIDQSKSIPKPVPSKPSQKPSNNSDDIITLD